MSYHKELLREIVEEWSVERLDVYIFNLKEKHEQLAAWIREVQLLKQRKTKKPPLETGPRDGR